MVNLQHVVATLQRIFQSPASCCLSRYLDAMQQPIECYLTCLTVEGELHMLPPVTTGIIATKYGTMDHSARIGAHRGQGPALL